MPTEQAPDFGSTLEVADRTWLVTGRPMNLAALEADVANALVHVAGDTLYLVDSGATPDFREPLRRVFGQAGAVRRIVLVNTHGHPDHVGNNGIVHELDAADVEHWLPRADLPIMHDSGAYFSANFADVDAYQPLPMPADQMADGLHTMFDPLDTHLEGARRFEDAVLEPLAVGGVPWPGWRITDDLWVLRSGGHTAGEVVAYLPKVRALHLSDESNGSYPTFHDSDPDKCLATIQRSIDAIGSGGVDALTDGHHFAVQRGSAATTFLQSIVDGYYLLDRAVHEALAGTGLPFDELMASVTTALGGGGLHGASENTLFFGMMVVKKLHELGVVADGLDLRTATLRLPAPEA